MNRFTNLARVTTATVGTGTVTLGAAVAGYKTFADAGLADGAIITYGLREGSNSEIGIGTYNSAGPTVSRDTVIRSTNADAKINLGGNAQVFTTAAAEDFDLVVNLQTGTTYTVLQTDRQKMICLTNAAAIAVTLPQATGHFGAGWSTLLKNVGSSKVTITPTTSTIGGASAITLEKGQTVKVISDGTNYYIIKAGGTGFYVQASAPTPAEVGDRWLDSDTGILYTYVPDGDSLQWVDLNSGDGFGDLLSTNNLSDVSNLSTSRLNLGVSPGDPQGRLTLTTLTSVLTSTVADATTIYYTPHGGRHAPLYDGTRWKMHDFGGELSQALSDTTKSPAAAASGGVYDMLLWYDAGTYRCTRSVVWSTPTTRGTGAGTAERELVGGLYVNKYDVTNGPAAQRGLYVGTIYVSADGNVDWILGGSNTLAILGVYNAFNQVNVSAEVYESTASWSYTTGTWRRMNNNSNMQIWVVRGDNDSVIDATTVQSMTSTSTPVCGIGVDWSSGDPNGLWSFGAAGGAYGTIATRYLGTPGVGFRTLSALEKGNTGATFYGYSASSWKCGISGKFRM